MPRTTVPIETPVGPYPTLPVTPDSADLAMTAADTVNKNQATFGTAQALLVIAQNTHAATLYTCTITSKADGLGRTGDIGPYDLAATEIAAFFLHRSGWRQDDNMLYFEANNAAVKFAVIPIY